MTLGKWCLNTEAWGHVSSLAMVERNSKTRFVEATGIVQVTLGYSRKRQLSMQDWYRSEAKPTVYHIKVMN